MKSTDYSPEDLTFYSKLKAVLRANGDLFPLTPHQIEAFENKHSKEGKISLSSLPDLNEILKNGKQYNLSIEENSFETQLYGENNFTYAARNGKVITDEIRRKMKQDRNQNGKELK
jgi:hypothetical protein